MTTETTEPKPAPAAGGSPSKPVLVAGLLGGVLGGLLGFALPRAFPTAPKVPAPSQPSEAHQFADHVLGKLKDGKNDEFMGFLRPAFAQMTDEQFAEFRKGVFDTRTVAAKLYGTGGGEFEFCRETTLSPTLVRISYLEKYARGCLLWSLVVYNAPDGWRVVACSVQTSESGFPALR